MKNRSEEIAGQDRREFLVQMGGNVALGGFGVGLLGASSPGPTLMRSGPEELQFGKLQRLTDLMAGSSLDQLQPALVKELEAGMAPQTLIAAGALANARAFGGQDYDGYHAFMALIPALEIAQSSSGKRAALPILKVLLRNTRFIHQAGMSKNPRLTQHADSLSNVYVGSRADDARELGKHVASHAMGKAEALFDDLVQLDPGRAFEALIPVLWMEVDVHRVVLAWRAWDMQRITGQDHARTLLRQSIRQCVDREDDDEDNRRVRREMPQVLEESGLMQCDLGNRPLGAEDVSGLALGISHSNRLHSAQLVAEQLAAGVDPQAIGEALSLAATYLMLRQRGRTRAAKGRPVGSVHGAGTGVHASDTAAAWRGMASFGSQRQCKLALVAGAYHAAGQGDRVAPQILDYQSREAQLRGRTPGHVLTQLNAAIGEQDQRLAAGAASAYAKLGAPMQPLLDTCKQHSIRAEGALHAEKYFRTQAEVIVSDRVEFRALHSAALARVCASQSGTQAYGLEQALELLG